MRLDVTSRPVRRIFRLRQALLNEAFPQASHAHKFGLRFGELPRDIQKRRQCCRRDAEPTLGALAASALWDPIGVARPCAGHLRPAARWRSSFWGPCSQAHSFDCPEFYEQAHAACWKRLASFRSLASSACVLTLLIARYRPGPHAQSFGVCRLRKRTPGPPPFSSMNSMPDSSNARRSLAPVSLRPPKGPS
jgi:hypothetical protein